jgi:hypothetical protein
MKVNAKLIMSVLLIKYYYKENKDIFKLLMVKN